jgi:hypothetical protein
MEDQAASIRMLKAIERSDGRSPASSYLKRLDTRDIARGREIDAFADQVLVKCAEITEAVILPRVLRLAAQRQEDQNRGGDYCARHVGRHQDRSVEPAVPESAREPVTYRLSRTR